MIACFRGATGVDAPVGTNQHGGGVMSKVLEITDGNFEEEVLQSGVVTEVDFWAPWCGPCLMVAPVYDKLSDEYAGRFKFCKINVDENPATAQRYGIRSIPMQMFFANGEKVDEILGAVPEEVIRTKVDEVLTKFPTDPEGRLKRILHVWVEHNMRHSETLKRWTENSEHEVNVPAYTEILQAARQLELANERLSQLLVESGWME
jgi:thioredoxin 1